MPVSYTHLDVYKRQEDILRVALDAAPDRELLAPGRGVDQDRQMIRNAADLLGDDPVLACDDRNLDAGAGQEVVDIPLVAQVAVEGERGVVAEEGVEDVRRVLVAPLELDLAVLEVFSVFLLPGGLTPEVLLEDCLLYTSRCV